MRQNLSLGQLFAANANGWKESLVARQLCDMICKKFPSSSTIFLRNVPISLASSTTQFSLKFMCNILRLACIMVTKFAPGKLGRGRQVGLWNMQIPGWAGIGMSQELGTGNWQPVTGIRTSSAFRSK